MAKTKIQSKGLCVDMDETGISKAEQVTLLKGLIEEGVRQKREIVFKHREAQEEMLRYGILLAFLVSISLVSILRDALIAHGIKSGDASQVVAGFTFGGLLDIFYLILGLIALAFIYKCAVAFSKYSSPIRMKDGTELPFREAAAAIDSMTKRNFRKLIEIRQGMTPAEMDATRMEPYRFDTVNTGYYGDAVRLTVPQIEKNKEEINEKRSIVVRDLEEIQVHRKTNWQLMVIAIVIAVVSRILDGPIANYFPTYVWKVWMVLSYLMFYGGIIVAIFYGIRYLYEKRENRLVPSIALIDQYENSIENYNYLLTDIEFMLVCAQRRKDPTWNKPVIDMTETKTISMAELTEAVAEAERTKDAQQEPNMEVRSGQTDPKTSQKENPYDLSYGSVGTDYDLVGSFTSSEVEPIDLMPNIKSPVEPEAKPSGVQMEGNAEATEPIAADDAKAAETLTEEANAADAAEPATEAAPDEKSEKAAADEQKKLEEYMRDLKRKAQEEADFSAELENEMERIRQMPQEEIVEEKEVAPQHPASSNLFYYPTATTREQTPFEDQNDEGNSYINHSAHAAEALADDEHAAFRHRTGGEKDKYNYDGRPKKATVLRRAAMSTDQDPVDTSDFPKEETPIRPAHEEPKVEEKKTTLRTSDEFEASMTEHMRSLQEDYGKQDVSAREVGRASTGQGSHVRMDREQGLTISLEDALKDLESYTDDEE